MKLIDNIPLYKRMEIINRVPFFRHFELSERELLLESHARLYLVHKGRFVFKQHEQSQQLYIVLSGELAVFRQSDLQILGYIQPGEFVGEGAFISLRERSTNARAQTDTIVFSIDAQALTKMPMSIREKIKDQLIIGMSARIAQLSKALEHDTLNEMPTTPE